MKDDLGYSDKFESRKPEQQASGTVPTSVIIKREERECKYIILVYSVTFLLPGRKPL